MNLPGNEIIRRICFYSEMSINTRVRLINETSFEMAGTSCMGADTHLLCGTLGVKESWQRHKRMQSHKIHSLGHTPPPIKLESSRDLSQTGSTLFVLLR